MSKAKGYQERFYRKWPKSNDLITQEVIVKETDLLISAEKDVKEAAEELVKKYRKEIEDYIKDIPEFLTTLEPMEFDNKAPLIVKEMIRTSKLAGVGPMASVAGAVAEFVGTALLTYSKQIIVENGGDIFIKSDVERTVAIFAGGSPLSNKLFIKIKPEDTPLGICTSSGTVGHSLSFGKADACVIISKSAALADAVATAACNRVKKKEDIKPALEFGLSIVGTGPAASRLAGGEPRRTPRGERDLSDTIEGIKGALIVLGKDFGVLGDVELG